MMFAFNVLITRWEDIVEDIRTGKLNDNLKIEPEIYDKIYIKKNEKRAAELTNIFLLAKSDNYLAIVEKLFKNIKYVGCIYTGNFNIYEHKLRHLCGSIPLYNFAYGLSESCVAISAGVNSINYIVDPTNAFFEFIPEAGGDCLTIDELQINNNYEIIITNHIGLYRYRTFDIIKVVGFYYSTPIIQYMYRSNVLINLNAEMMSEQQCSEAIINTIGINNLINYTIVEGINYSPPCYIYYIETVNDINIYQYNTMINDLNRNLIDVNPRYGDRLNRERLQNAKLNIVRSKTFDDLDLLICEDGKDKGISNVQVKIPKILKKNKYIEFMNNNIINPI